MNSFTKAEAVTAYGRAQAKSAYPDDRCLQEVYANGIVEYALGLTLGMLTEEQQEIALSFIRKAERRAA